MRQKVHWLFFVIAFASPVAIIAGLLNVDLSNVFIPKLTTPIHYLVALAIGMAAAGLACLMAYYSPLPSGQPPRPLWKLFGWGFVALSVILSSALVVSPLVDAASSSDSIAPSPTPSSMHSPTPSITSPSPSPLTGLPADGASSTDGTSSSNGASSRHGISSNAGTASSAGTAPNPGNPPSPVAPSNPVPVSEPTATDVASGPTKTSVRAICSGLRQQMKPGEQFTLTYEIDSPATSVGLGVGLYDEQGKDHSTGTGDLPKFDLAVGHTTKSRPVFIPKDLAKGIYEVVGEVWPPSQVGAEGAETITEDTCGVFTIT